MPGRIRRLDQALQILTKCLKLKVLAKPEEYLQQITDALVSMNLYDLSWVNQLLPDGSVEIVAASAHDGDTSFITEVLKPFKLRWDNVPEGQGPTGISARTGKSIAIHGTNDPTLTFWKNLPYWKERGQEFGYKSGYIVPCHCTDRPVIDPSITPNQYQLVVVSSDIKAFSSDLEVKVLENIGISLGSWSYEQAIFKRNDELLQKIRDGILRAVYTVSEISEHRDPYTKSHQTEVSRVSTAIAKELGWDEHRIEGVGIGALLHDVGKIGIPDSIVKNQNKLTDEEYEVMKAHPTIGYHIVKHIDFPWPIKEIVYQHHERLDGSGYPNGLSGDDIIDEAKIVAVADVYNAVSCDRPYRKGLGHDAGIKVLRAESGSSFDQQIVSIVEKLHKEGKI